MGIHFLLAVVGLIFEVIGLLVLLGKTKSKTGPLGDLKIGNLDHWQQDIDKLIEDQRKKHLVSSVFIVLGICLQTFPEYLFNNYILFANG